MQSSRMPNTQRRGGKVCLRQTPRQRPLQTDPPGTEIPLHTDPLCQEYQTVVKTLPCHKQLAVFYECKHQKQKSIDFFSNVFTRFQSAKTLFSDHGLLFHLRAFRPNLFQKIIPILHLTHLHHEQHWRYIFILHNCTYATSSTTERMTKVLPLGVEPDAMFWCTSLLTDNRT